MGKKSFTVSHIPLFIFLYFIFFIITIFAQDTTTKEKLVSVADAILKNASFRFVDQNGKVYESTDDAPANVQLHLESPYNDWRYWNGVLNIAMLQLGEVLKDSIYKEFSIHNISFCFDNYKFFKERFKKEGKWSYPFGQFFIMDELDDYGAMGGSLIEVYNFDPQERYKDYLETAAKQILYKQSRLDDGTLVRTFPYKWTLWADDLYMSISFLSRYGRFTGDNLYFDDAIKQVINFNKYLFNPVFGLMYHYWYSDNNSQGVAFWGRANGWTMLAQVDLLDRLPKDHPQRDTLIKLLGRQIKSLARYQGPEGLWHQLLDKVDSYSETSCSAMFTYAIARAVNKGYIEPRYASIARQGWDGIITKISPDGKVKDVCTGTGTADDLVFYYHRPTPLNDIHGVGAVLLAGSEILKLPK